RRPPCSTLFPYTTLFRSKVTLEFVEYERSYGSPVEPVLFFYDKGRIPLKGQGQHVGCKADQSEERECQYHLVFDIGAQPSVNPSETARYQHGHREDKPERGGNKPKPGLIAVIGERTLILFPVVIPFYFRRNVGALMLQIKVFK